MPEFVMKADPDRDLYVLWSTVFDDWIGISDRQSMLDYLVDEMESAQCYVDPLINPVTLIESDLERADCYGSSYKYCGTWEDEYLAVRGGYQLRRVDLGKYLDSILMGDSQRCQSLLSPRPFD